MRLFRPWILVAIIPSSCRSNSLMCCLWLGAGSFLSSSGFDWIVWYSRARGLTMWSNSLLCGLSWTLFWLKKMKNDCARMQKDIIGRVGIPFPLFTLIPSFFLCPPPECPSCDSSLGWSLIDSYQRYYSPLNAVIGRWLRRSTISYRWSFGIGKDNMKGRGFDKEKFNMNENRQN